MIFLLLKICHERRFKAFCLLVHLILYFYHFRSDIDSLVIAKITICYVFFLFDLYIANIALVIEAFTFGSVVLFCRRGIKVTFTGEKSIREVLSSNGLGAFHALG